MMTIRMAIGCALGCVLSGVSIEWISAQAVDCDDRDP